jgi:hypothetical protein
MIEAITAAGLEPAQAATTTGSAANSPQASHYDIRDFAAALERNGVQGTQATEAAATQAVPKSSDGMRTMLAAFDHLNGGAENVRELAQKLAANPGDASPSQIIQLTMASHQFMFQCELTSNVANRTSDGIQQLFRQQS